MAVEWYLLNSPHSQLSGFEGDALNDFAQEGFAEMLDSSIALDVELYNYDLSVCEQIRAIIQNNVQDTKLKSLSRLLFVPIGTCKAGMYIKYKGRYWLIVGLVDDNGMYEKAIMMLCNYHLTWENHEHQIVQRWASISSASQYNNGETSNQYMHVRTDQLLILTPNDDECILLDSGTRFIIDKRCSVYEKSFDENVFCDTSNPVITYELTRSDSVLYDYQDSGHYEFLAYQDEQHNDDGYYLIDGKGYWLCGKPQSDNKSIVLSAIIDCESSEIYNGLEPSVFTARFINADNEEVDVAPQWEFKCDFVDQLHIEYDGKSILISANNKKLLNKSFELILGAEGYESTNIPVVIRAFM